jgi:hypothetical protein
MPDIIQSIRTKIEFVMICLALLGMMSTGIYVYHDQTSRLNMHSADIAGMKDKDKSHEAKSQALSDVISATIIPTLNAQGKDIITHTSRLDSMERNARADREILIEIRNDLKWMRERIDK